MFKLRLYKCNSTNKMSYESREKILNKNVIFHYDTHLSAIDVLDSRFSEEKIHKITLCKRADKIWRCKKVKIEYCNKQAM